MSDAIKFPKKKKKPARTPLLGKPAETIELGPHNFMTVEQVAKLFERNHRHYHQVIICGYDEDDEFFLMSSCLQNKDALWIAEHLRKAVTGGME